MLVEEDLMVLLIPFPMLFSNQICHYPNFSATNYSSIASHEFTFEASTTAITLPEADTTADDTFYTLNGQRMSGRPNKAGIYIHKGKKVIVR